MCRLWTQSCILCMSLCNELPHIPYLHVGMRWWYRSHLFEHNNERERVTWWWMWTGGWDGWRWWWARRRHCNFWRGWCRRWLRWWRRNSGHLLVGRVFAFWRSQFAGSTAAQGCVWTIGVQRALHWHRSALCLSSYSIWR